MTAPVSFGRGDEIKFHAIGYLAETAIPLLPRLRDRTYLVVNIVEKNGVSIPPTSLEVGLYKDELPPSISLRMDGDNLAIDGLNEGNYWTASLKGGFPRATKEMVGKLIALGSAPFIDVQTLKDTSEAIASRADTHQEPITAPPRSDGWFSRLGLGQRKPSA